MIDEESSKAELLLEILMQLLWRLLDQNQSRFDSEAAAEHNNELLLDENTQMTEYMQ